MDLVQVRVPQDELDVMILSDCHIGSKWFNTLAWQYAIDLAKREHMHVLFNGDLLDCSTINSKTPPWDQAVGLTDAMKISRGTVEPIATQVDAATGGNHGRRLYNSAGLDPEREVWERLQVPYLDRSGVIQYHLGKDANPSRGQRATFTIYMHHTAMSGRLAGAGFTAAEKLTSVYEGADVYLAGHSHKLGAMTVDRNNMAGGVKGSHVVQRHVWLVCCGSFLDWNHSYGEAGQYAPSPVGYCIVHLSRSKGVKAWAVPL